MLNYPPELMCGFKKTHILASVYRVFEGSVSRGHTGLRRFSPQSNKCYLQTSSYFDLISLCQKGKQRLLVDYLFAYYENAG